MGCEIIIVEIIILYAVNRHRSCMERNADQQEQAVRGDVSMFEVCTGMCTMQRPATLSSYV